MSSKVPQLVVQAQLELQLQLVLQLRLELQFQLVLQLQLVLLRLLLAGRGSSMKEFARLVTSEGCPMGIPPPDTSVVPAQLFSLYSSFG